MTHARRALLVLALTAGLLCVGQAALPSAGAATIVNVTPAMPATVPDNGYPFGIGAPNQWPPFMGFIYKNVPAFQLKTGDVLAFDLIAMNNADIQLQIELAPTTTNSGDVPSLPFTTVVTNTQTPANPRGDTTLETTAELKFTAQAPFSFPGGGLIIRFSNPSASYATDMTQTAVLGGATDSDSSGFFVKRFYADSDGIPPYPNFDMNSLAGFRLTLLDTPPSAGPGANAPTTKKKCKKHKHRSASVAKKHCKKKHK